MTCISVDKLSSAEYIRRAGTSIAGCESESSTVAGSLALCRLRDRSLQHDLQTCCSNEERGLSRLRLSHIALVGILTVLTLLNCSRWTWSVSAENRSCAGCICTLSVCSHCVLTVLFTLVAVSDCRNANQLPHYNHFRIYCACPTAAFTHRILAEPLLYLLGTPNQTRWCEAPRSAHSGLHLCACRVSSLLSSVVLASLPRWMPVSLVALVPFVFWLL